MKTRLLKTVLLSSVLAGVTLAGFESNSTSASFPFGFATEVKAAEGYKLTLKLNAKEKALSNVPLEIFLIASGSDGDYQLSSDFEGLNVKLSDYHLSTASQAEELVKRVQNYISENSVIPLLTGETNSSGTLVFPDLEAGLYYVPSIVTEVGETSIETEPTIRWLSSDLTAYPKGGPDKPGDEPDNPGSDVDIDSNDPLGNHNTPNSNGSSSGTINSSIKDPASGSSSTSNVGVNSNDPTSATAVNTAAQNDQNLYLIIFSGALLSLSAILLLFRNKEKQAD